MKIAIATFDRFNEIDSFVACHMLNRVSRPGWKAEIAAPTPGVTSMNGVTIQAQRPLEFVNEADVVLFGSGRATREIVEDDAIMNRMRLDPERQLIASQCSGGLMLARLGLLKDIPACTDSGTRPYLEAAGAKVLDGPFYAQGNIASAGGCLSAQYLATWVIWRLLGKQAVRDALDYVVPVGQESEYIDRALATVAPFMTAT